MTNTTWWYLHTFRNVRTHFKARKTCSTCWHLKVHKMLMKPEHLRLSEQKIAGTMEWIVVLHIFLDEIAVWFHVVLHFRLLICQLDYHVVLDSLASCCSSADGVGNVSISA